MVKTQTPRAHVDRPRPPATGPVPPSPATLGQRLRRAREIGERLLDPPSRPDAPGSPVRRLDALLSLVRDHEQLVDALLALVLLGVSLVNGLQLPRHTVPTVAFSCLLALPLAGRRRAPLTVFAFMAAVAFVQWLVWLPFFGDTALFIVLYTVAAARPRRAAITATVVLEAGAVMAAIRWSPDRVWPQTIVLLSGAVLAAVVSGIHMRARRSYVEGLLERAERLEFERDQQARLAAVAERARIAREMHDLIAHSLAVVISLANGATAKLRRDPEQARDALESISELGRQGLEDIRQLLSILRADEVDDPRAPQPGIDDIAQLVEQAGATGLRATLSIVGDPVPVATGPALGAYRIVQEAITNTLKHADDATELAVELSFADHWLQISVSDDGRPGSSAPASPGGYGLAGMRERAALYGGRVTAGNREHGGWAVTALIPIARTDRP